MMKAAYFGKRHNLSHLWKLHRSAIWRILPQREMAATFMIILEVRNDVAPERGLVQDYNVVETLASDRADQPFDVWTLPRRPACGEPFCDCHALGLCPEGVTVDAVTIPEQKPRTFIPRKCLDDLGRSPLSGRVIGDIEMHDAPSVVGKDDKHIQQPEIHSGYHEEIHGYELFDVIFEEGSPSLGG
jgi:hypothetical protein